MSGAMSVEEECPRTEALSALVDDALEAQARSALDAHVAGCALCAPMLAEFRRLHASFAALPDTAPGIDLAPLIERRIAQAAKEPKVTPKPRRWRWWQFAPPTLGGAVALSLGAYLGSALMTGSRIAAPPATMQMAVFRTIPPGALCPAAQICNRTGR